ncbi:MAG TPA: PH domain-containing protein [Gammaproteobacteria bacterium]|jgi:uncharacterized membrane protein YdbT with pleckstrin-like domain|nr:PH domain-containing protein [Gammaproteobacteria bacterium]
MSYIDRNLLPEERILFRTKKHLIIFFIPVVWLIFSVYASDYMNANDLLQKLAWAPWALAALLWGSTALNYYFSDFAVTNKRVMMREGFFVRHTNELRLSAISQVNVDQSIFGQILNYGTLSINAFGAFDAYTVIARPYQFQRTVNQEMDQALSNK